MTLARATCAYDNIQRELMKCVLLPIFIRSPIGLNIILASIFQSRFESPRTEAWSRSNCYKNSVEKENSKNLFFSRCSDPFLVLVTTRVQLAVLSSDIIIPSLESAHHCNIYTFTINHPTTFTLESPNTHSFPSLPAADHDHLH